MSGNATTGILKLWLGTTFLFQDATIQLLTAIAGEKMTMKKMKLREEKDNEEEGKSKKEKKTENEQE